MPADGTVSIALISAGAALAGVLLSQIAQLLQWCLQTNHQRRVLLREKYEELALSLAREMSWIADVDGSGLLSTQATSAAPAPHPRYPRHARHAVTLSYIYFPLLIDLCEAYMNACTAYLVMVIESQPGSSSSALANAYKHNRESFASHSDNLKAAHEELEEAITLYAPLYAKA